uniref:(+)-kolavenyl diphosphate synthase n=1 Tax=Vitiosangium cumulatum TaxID=1867796 RepID=A0A7D4XH60_9BACT|nr:(+)-kolavenyl diphosphate synthase [Vitiosangium cumulatum]
MKRIQDVLVAELHSLISTLGSNGGLMSPSVYDTAQMLRILPQADGVWPAVDWLLEQQQSDGGWGEPAMPLHRDVPTLAAILALREYNRRHEVRVAIREGVAFIRRQGSMWSTAAKAGRDDLPVGGEIVLPGLLDQLDAAGEMHIPRGPYGPLLELGERKRKAVAGLPPVPGMPWNHCWELTGSEPHASLIDASGGLSHSPAATAAWVNAASNRPELEETVQRARKYLANAERACEVGIPGVTSTIYPFERYEQLFSLYALQIAGILKDPRVESVVAPIVKELAGALGSKGIAMSDYFLQDGDDTAAAVMLLHEFGYPVDLSILYRFQNDNHFVAYAGELHPSPTVTARCIHALMVMGKDVAPFQRFLLERRELDGRWTVDKWNRSWLYTTGHAAIALMGSPYERELREAVEAVLVSQHRDGGWSTHGPPNMTETAYAVLMLAYLERQGFTHAGIGPALDHAFTWMLDNYCPFSRPKNKVKCWIAKELYRVERIDTIFELSAMLMLDQRRSKEKERGV